MGHPMSVALLLCVSSLSLEGASERQRETGSGVEWGGVEESCGHRIRRGRLVRAGLGTTSNVP